MVALLISTVLLISASALMVYMFKKHSDNFESGHMHTQLHPAMNIMRQKIAQAGFWSSAFDGEPYNLSGPGPANPFTAAGYDLRTGSGGQCLLFTYDRNRDGAVSDEERVGYRVTSGVIEEGSQATDCATGTWATLTEIKAVSISSLQFTISSEIIGSFTRRSVSIVMRGEPISKAAEPLVMRYTVRIKNDKAI